LFTLSSSLYEIVELDRRHSYHKIYKYSIEFSKASWKGTGALDFDRARRWFNESFGWSQEVDVQKKIASFVAITHQANDINFHWAFTTQYRNYRIYVSSDKELAWFQLSHVRES
jgi:hypothetical protein